MKVTMHVCKGCVDDVDGDGVHRVAICGHSNDLTSKDMEFVTIDGCLMPAHQRCDSVSFVMLFPNENADRCADCDARLQGASS